MTVLQPVDRMPTAPPIPPITVAGAGVALATAATTVNNQVAGAGSGYVFSPEEIDAVIKDWEDLLDEIMDDHEEATAIANVQAPGLEFASSDYASAAGRSGQVLVEQIARMREYVSDYITALKDAKNATRAQDEQAATDVQNVSGESA